MHISHTLEFLMPCFCAGANQAIAELRAPSVRGQLRWWFRALGGTRDQELEVFGGLDDKPSASRLLVRVRETNRKAAWAPPKVNPNLPSSYVWYFPSVSGESKGMRWTTTGLIPPGSQWELQISDATSPQQVSAAAAQVLDLAVRCFVTLGAIGLRATRGLGTFKCVGHPVNHKELEWLCDSMRRVGFLVEIRSELLGTVDEVATEIGLLVKGTRKALGMKNDRPTPFGSSTPRQTSAVYFRPVQLTGESGIRLVIFEAPHSKVLGPKSRTSLPVLQQGLTYAQLNRGYR